MDPNVKFLYRAMHERDPRKRKVKPVAPNLIQVNFGGLDDSDEDDSDFDISKKGQKQGKVNTEAVSTKSDQTNGEDSDDSSEEEDDDDDDDDSDDDDLEDDDENEEEDLADDDDEEHEVEEEEGKGDQCNSMEYEGEEEGEADVESMTETEESDTDSSDVGDQSLAQRDDPEREVLSPPIKSLGNIWNSIDSDEDDEDYVPQKRRKKNAKKDSKASKSAEGQKVKGQAQANGGEQTEATHQQHTGPQKRIKVIVCCVCLSDKSSEEEEIVECDSCGISVHEGCYGLSESQSVASTESSASTEPWFCDACKAGVTKPVCELCPNSGGVFKETDAGKWVHLVCALYTPGVAFGDVDKLNMVTLFEMPYARWGAKECILCEDVRFSQTGVCINCDAGMCKAYFHVTCAQREGLLAELSPDDVMEVADPFFAYCKLHADKYLCKMKRRNWLAIQSHVKSYIPCPITDEKEKARFQRKLAHHRDKYSLIKQKRPPAWVPTQKMVRHLHTSPSALRGFIRKAELMGILTQVQSVPLESKDTLKKPPPGIVSFTSDFISYFMERNVKVDNLRHSLSELTAQNKRLQSQENVVRRQYEKLSAEVAALKQKSNTIRMDGESLCGILGDIYGRSVPNIPEVFTARKKRAGLRKEAPVVSSELINQCGMCQLTTDQHLLAKCDKCRQHYHLGCLDPPLTRMPKKTKLFGWQCSFCVKSSSGDSVRSHPDVNQPRKLRETIKGPDKYFLLNHIQESLNSQRKKSLQSKKSKKKSKARMEASQNKGSKVTAKWKSPAENTTSFKKSKSKLSAVSKAKVKGLPSDASTTHHLPSAHAIPTAEELYTLDIICVVCNQKGQLADTVRCDDCLLSYHLGCLSPPMKKSPKVRGYAWHCEACDMSNSDEEVTGRRSQRSEVATPEGGGSTRQQGRVASNGVLFDIDVSSDDM